ncbi:penicillin-binding transpeptidase domain-containing protein [Kingella negevensis]|uniref:penicillin-binding transpeptidase domain-containing protein n=1 Tax=Kingella negevensis TaxID=1522312 RepID=UPI00255105EA|nr:penicillin-binding transpeptidase domain-containing protein [Kingella negevensis]MDK4698719.1 penicillin-binding transpeptidase domain-containing protein [Kingella negevensis]
MYSAALSKGMTPNTMVNGGAITIGKWSPQNVDGTYRGMMTLRQAITVSRNTVNVRLAQCYGSALFAELLAKIWF